MRAFTQEMFQISILAASLRDLLINTHTQNRQSACIFPLQLPSHYNDVTMSAMASQITSLPIVYLTVSSSVDQRKHQSSASLAFVCGEFTGDRWIARTKGQLRGKCFHLMTSSYPEICKCTFRCKAISICSCTYFQEFSLALSKFSLLFPEIYAPNSRM